MYGDCDIWLLMKNKDIINFEYRIYLFPEFLTRSTP